MLSALNIQAQVEWRDLGGAPWLCISCPSLSPSALKLLSVHSSIYMGALLENGLLRPFDYKPRDYLPQDMAELLKYKGKTNAAFTALMFNCALCASAFSQTQEPLFVMDPMCGKATSLFCALRLGHNAIGVETDPKDVQEAGAFISRYLQFHRIKHQASQGSLTLPGGKSAPFTQWQLADTPEHYQAEDTRIIKLINGDTLYCAVMQKRETIHIMIADLPYGVQHAPKQGQRTGDFLTLLGKALPGWHQVLKPGGAIALSFNAYTIKKADLARLLKQSGFVVRDTAPYDDFEHWVEQAVSRDLLVAVKE